MTEHQINAWNEMAKTEAETGRIVAAVQFRLSGDLGTVDELVLRQSIEMSVGFVLEASGCGEVDGGDSGLGVANVWCELQQQRLMEGLLIIKNAINDTVAGQQRARLIDNCIIAYADTKDQCWRIYHPEGAAVGFNPWDPRTSDEHRDWWRCKRRGSLR